MRNKTLAEFNRVAGGQMRPFGTIETRELRIIGIINSGRVRHLQQRVPTLLARHDFVFELFQPAAIRETDEDNLAAAGANFFDGRSHICKTLLDAFLHLRHENIFWNVTRWRRRREKREPDLLNSFRQFAAWFSALLPHPRAPLAIFGLKIRRERRRNVRARTVWDLQSVQECFE